MNSNNSAAWTQAPERGSHFLMRVMIWLSLRLGRTVSRGVLHLIAVYFLLLSPKVRKVSRAYLRRALGRPAGWRDSYRQFFAFASTLHDRIFFAQGRFDLFTFSYHGEAVLDPILSMGQGLFLVGAHLGSFEALHAMAHDHAKLRAIMVMHEENANKINGLLRYINPHLVLDVIALGHIGSMIKVAERLAEGCVIGILADRTPVLETMQPVQLLGAQALLPTGPFRMAALLKRPVLFMVGLYMGGNHYAIHFETLADFTDIGRGQRAAAIESAIQRYAALVEQYCRKAPYNWFNFFDFWQVATPPTHTSS